MRRAMARISLISVFLLGACVVGPQADLQDGWEQMKAEDWPAARATYEGLLVDYPTNPYAHLNLGFVYQELGEFDKARVHYEAAIQYGKTAEVTSIVEEGKVTPTITMPL